MCLQCKVDYSYLGECMWLHCDLIKKCMEDLKKCQFKQVEYAWTSVPTYPCGTIGFLVASKSDAVNVKEPVNSPNEMNLKFYSPELHKASFVLPRFVQETLE